MRKRLSRRAFLGTMTTCAAAVASCRSVSRPRARESRLNVLLITSDDMNYDSLGLVGCNVPDVTPNLDRLARESVRFQYAHVNVAVCQPSRQCIMTGLYPHNMGAPNFDPVREDVTTLTERLRAAGYVNGILGKETHLAPKHKFCWDHFVGARDLGHGREPQRFYEETKTFLGRAQSERKPFFLMANSHDPHRAFAGSQDELRRYGRHLPVSRTYHPDEIEVPGFLPDLPGVREDIAYYFNSVHRGDETVGAVLRALDEAGLADNTLVMWLSDNGMAFPFSKRNCYLASTSTPWLARWPGVTEEGTVDARHFIVGVDYTPTMLEALGLEPIPKLDGRSFEPLLRGKRQSKRNHAFTLLNDPTIRCMQNRRFGYIWNAWADGKTTFQSKYLKGPAYEALMEAAKSDPFVAARMELFFHRVPEELYDFEQDPSALHNLVNSPEHQGTLDNLRRRLHAEMTRSADPMRTEFEWQLKDKSHS